MVRRRRADDTSYYIDRGLAYRIEMPDRNAHIISLGRIIGDRWVHSFFPKNTTGNNKRRRDDDKQQGDPMNIIHERKETCEQELRAEWELAVANREKLLAACFAGLNPIPHALNVASVERCAVPFPSTVSAMLTSSYLVIVGRRTQHRRICKVCHERHWSVELCDRRLQPHR